MAGLLKSFFSPSSDQKKQQAALRSIENMSLAEILSYIQKLRDTSLSSGQVTSLMQRLYTIALYDNHVSDEDRETSIKLADSLFKITEEAWTDKPEAIDALKKANESMIEGARTIGFGSLAWKLQEESISAEYIAAYAMQPDHRHLVPNFRFALGEELWTKNKREFVRQIILSESYEGNNAVIILHGLATKGDKAVAAIFTQEEFTAFVNVPNNYAAGRNILVDLGLLPKESGALHFKPIPGLNGLVVQIIKDRKDSDNGDPRLSELPDIRKTALLVALDLMRIVLAHAHIQQIYGKEAGDQVLEKFTDPSLKNILERVSKIPELIAKIEVGKPIDYIILNDILAWDDLDAKNEEEYEKLTPFLMMGAEWINFERVGFQCYLRFMLRAMSDPIPEIKSDADKEINSYLMTIYQRKGASASLAEKAVHFEDWIGFDSI